MLSTTFLFLVFFAIFVINVDSFLVIRRSRHRRANRRRQRERAQALALDLKNKCDFANKIFPALPNTSPAEPIKSLKYIYDRDPKMDLWVFQKLNCLPPPPLTRIEIFNVFKIFATAFYCYLWLLFNIWLFKIIIGLVISFIRILYYCMV